MTILRQLAQYRSVLITALLLAAFVVSCYGTGLGTAMSQPHVQAQSENQAACCSGEQDQSAFWNHGPMSFTLPAAGVLMIAAAALAFAFTRFWLRQTLQATPMRLYARTVRIRYGSSQRFRPLIEQLRSGLLRPKTF